MMFRRYPDFSASSRLRCLTGSGGAACCRTIVPTSCITSMTAAASPLTDRRCWYARQVGKSTSFVANYYVDMVSSASIDVVTTASPYTEERKQWSLGMDYLRGNTTMSINYTSSVESDFDATTYSFAVSQDMFGDLTTLTLTYALGDDIVGDSSNPDFERDNDRQHYGVGLTQILTRNLIYVAEFRNDHGRGISEQSVSLGALCRSRQARSATATRPSCIRTRAPAARLGCAPSTYLPYRAALSRASIVTSRIPGTSKVNTTSLAYTHPMGPWTFTAKYRYHDQTGAYFFSDLFPRVAGHQLPWPGQGAQSR